MEVLQLAGGICLAVWLVETLVFVVSYRSGRTVVEESDLRP